MATARVRTYTISLRNYAGSRQKSYKIIVVDSKFGLGPLASADLEFDFGNL